MNLILRFFISLTFFVFGAAGVLHAQTTWTGTVSTDWDTDGNWSAGIPTATSDVVIPNVTNDPVISTSTALAFSIQVHNGALLTITAAGNLTINTTASDAIWNMGTVENNGIITIGNLTGLSTYGINNESVFNNNAGGQINIDSTSIMAIINTGAINNWGDITLGANNSPGAAGLQNSGTFFNNFSAHISIDRTTGTALVNDGGSFTNQGYINIGAHYDCQSGVANVGLGTFRNEHEIAIDRVMGTGLLNFSGTFNNAGEITLGEIASAGAYGIMNASTFQNEGLGRIQIDRASTAGMSNAANFFNQGDIKIGTLSTAGNYGIYNLASFNNSTGSITIEQVASTGVYNGGTDFTNAGSLTIDGSFSTVDIGIDNYAVFNNNVGGNIFLKGLNDAIITNDNTFNNNATITTNSPSQVSTLIAPGASGTFSNNTGGVINASATIYTDNYVDAGGTLAPGDHIGKLIFDSNKGFTNSKLAIEIQGTGTPGTDFDAVEVVGTATMGGDLIITTPGFTPSPGQSFVILTANSVTGTFASVTWPAGFTGTVSYGATTVTLNILSLLPLTLVEFSGNATGHKTALQWKTADEVNTASFELERSTNGIDYTTIATVKAIGHGANSYNTTDEDPVAGNNYYRLKMKDLDGKFTLSQVITLKHVTKDGLQLSPVPAGSYVTVQLKDQSLLNQRAQVYNSAGHMITEVMLTNGARINTTGWAAGLYIIKTNTASYQFMKQ